MWVAALCSTLYYLKDDDVSIHFFIITHIGGRKTGVKVLKWQRKEGKEGRKKKD